MITVTVYDSDGAKHEFDDTSKIRTDEHNNLEIHEGEPGSELLTYLFNRQSWMAAEVDYDAS